jgi:hypothetical protein
MGSSDALQRALDGDASAARELVRRLTPVVQTRVTRALLGASAAEGRTTLQEVADFTQEVFAMLFEGQGRALRAWDERRGLSLENFVGFLATRQVAAILRTGKRSPWTETPTLEDELVNVGPTTEGPDGALASKQLLRLILSRLPLELSPQGLDLFERLLVQQQPVDDVVAATGLSPDAVYAWKSRLTRRVRALAKTLSDERSSPHTPKGSP